MARAMRVWLVLGAALLLTAGACSSGSSTASPPTFSATPSVAAATPTPVPTATPVPAHWAAAGSMAKQRFSFPLVTLQDGRALAIGDRYNVCQGECSGFPRPDQSARFADLYDPGANTWSATNGLNLDRSSYTTTVLTDGRVLVAGGYANPPNVCYSSAKLFDPSSNTWSQTTGLMKLARCAPGAALLHDGRVLLVGGMGIKFNSLSSAEIFDPASQTWTAAASMPSARMGPLTVTLGNGKVLAIGGEDRSSATARRTYLYDPATNKWSIAGDVPEVPNGQLVALADGSAMLVGEASLEWNAADELEWVKSPSERFDPATNVWARTADMATVRSGPSVVRLADGSVLVAGGAVSIVDDANVGRITTLTDTAEIYDPTTDSWSAAPAMPDLRMDAPATLLLDGSVLIAGGDLGPQGFAATPGGFQIDLLASAVRYFP